MQFSTGRTFALFPGHTHKPSFHRQMQFCQWFQQMVNEDEEYVMNIVWSDEAQFKLNGTVNSHNCVYWAPENLHVHVDKAVNITGVNVWCGV